MENTKKKNQGAGSLHAIQSAGDRTFDIIKMLIGKYEINTESFF